MSAVVTLITDLGTREPFSAMIKGELISRCPGLQIVDLTNEIPPRQIIEGAIFLLGAIPYFPVGTIHLVNVGAGTRPIVAKVKGQVILCPDNGVLSLLELLHGVDEVREIEVKGTDEGVGKQILFGREVFAPAAASLVRGHGIDSLGKPVDSWRRLDIPVPEIGAKRIEGRIMHTDRFGNLITNIHSRHLDGKVIERVSCGSFSSFTLSARYDEVPEGKPLALVGHSGYLELAYNGESAGGRLKLSPGLLVSVILGR